MNAILRRAGLTRFVADHPHPAPVPGEAIVRPTLAALAPADAAAARGDTAFEGVLGHQFVGVVESTLPRPGSTRDADLAAALAGKRVVANINIVPLDAPLARRGLGNHAPERAVLGLYRRDGCLAQRVSIPLANLVPVPDSIPDEHAVFAEPLAAAIHASRIVNLEGKAYVTVLGDNLSAMLCAQVMAKLNRSVRVLAESDRRFHLCEKWAVRHRTLADVGLRNDQDVVIECTGRPDMVALAMRLARPRGSIILKREPLPLPAEPAPPPARDPAKPPTNQPKNHPLPLDLTPVILNELELLGARCGNVAEAVDLLLAGTLDLAALVTKPIPLQDAPGHLTRPSDTPHQPVAVSPN